MLALLLSLFACSSAEIDITGTINGGSFEANTAYWGNQYVVFVDKELDCMDMSWVQQFNLQGEDPPTKTDLRALQITYNNEENLIYEGQYSVGGEAPIKTEFLEISGDIFNVDRATEGILDLETKVDEETLTGSLNFAFTDGAISGTFSNVEWCLNIKP